MTSSLKRRPSNEANEAEGKRFQAGIDSNLSQTNTIAVLVSLIPGREGKYTIEGTPVTTIGRSRNCDIALAEPDISTLHCELCVLTVELDGSKRQVVNIVDRSRNGTFVNGNRLVKRDYILRNGDRIVFGRSCSFLFKYLISKQEEGEEEDGFEVSSVVASDESSKKDSFKRPTFSSQDVVRRPASIRKPTFFARFVLGKELGTGHYAIVKEATDKDSGDIVAVKIFHPQQNDDQKKTKQFREETKILMSIQHRNIVKLIDRFVEPVSKSQIQTYLVLEKVNDGELFDRIVRKTKLGQEETNAIFRQILHGLRYLHTKNIIHRDIKPENILLSIKRRKFPEEEQRGPWDKDEIDIKIKIADFGLAKFIGEMQFTNTLCGTPSYVAPEVLKKTGYTSKVDLWSAGVLLYVCLCGFPPFSEQLSPPSMKEQILQGKLAFYSPYWDKIDDSCLHLISNLLVVNPAFRYDVQKTIDHPWFSNALSERESSAPLQRQAVAFDKVPKTYSELSNLQS
ncbi:LAME_0E05094g1_1 [Lachancea meyersii CBS 8951]|uniref:LAME_0E05094g1_1 n=1 Tax=Lachancea meyersii CBS 8951 TaxID=1266667 RepID=A0A1G4JH68_9SACH|nr:LAME_0E05094g1_1 [Lachancea meyersii CBS 8951]